MQTLTDYDHHVVVMLDEGNPDVLVFTDKDKAVANAVIWVNSNLASHMDEIPSFDTTEELFDFHNNYFWPVITWVGVRPCKVY